MTINERIKNLGEYFVTFNVNEGIAYVLVNFPPKWTLFDAKAIGDEYGINITPREKGVFFLCDAEQGFDCLFDAIDFIIENNLSLEEKTNLLKQKIQELSEIFEREPLDKLKKLQFVFSEPVELDTRGVIPADVKEKLKKGKKGNKKVEKTLYVNDPVVTEVKIDESDDKTNVIESATYNDVTKESDDLLDFAKSMVESDE